MSVIARSCAAVATRMSVLSQHTCAGVETRMSVPSQKTSRADFFGCLDDHERFAFIMKRSRVMRILFMEVAP
jgi:hypothetical protein